VKKLKLIIFFLLFLTGSSVISVGQRDGKNDMFRFNFLYSEGLKNKMLENYGFAISSFEECLKLNANSSASAYQLSIIFLKTLEFQKAEYYINYALKLNKKNEWYVLQKAMVAKMQGNNKLYKECYTKLNLYYPNNPTYSYELAIIYLKDKQFKLSLKLLNKIEDEFGVIENISFLKNNIFFETKKYPLIKNELEKLIKVNPDSVKYTDMLGEYFLSTKNYNAALNIYTESLKKFDNSKQINLKISKIEAILSNYTKGLPYLIKGIGTEGLSAEKQYEIANFYILSETISKNQKKEIFKQFFAFFSSYSKLHDDYISFLLKEKEISLAEIKIKEILSDNGENFNLWNSLFSIYISQNRVKDLNKYAEEAKSFFPNQSLVYFYSGYSFFMLNKYEQAANSLLNGLDYIVENDKLEKDFYLYLAEAFHAQNLNKKSDLYFDKYLAKDSLNAYLLNNYAYYLSQRKREIAKAFKLSKKSIEIEPFNSSFLDTYAWIYYLKSDFKNALFFIEKAYKYGGKDNTVICEHYGDILFKNGKKDEALKKWRESLKLKPNNSVLIDKISKIAN